MIRYALLFLLFLLPTFAFAQKMEDVINSDNQEEIYQILETLWVEDVKNHSILEQFSEKLMRLPKEEVRNHFKFMDGFMYRASSAIEKSHDVSVHTLALLIKFKWRWHKSLNRIFDLSFDEINKAYPDVIEEFLKNPPGSALEILIPKNLSGDWPKFLQTYFDDFIRNRLYFTDIPGFIPNTSPLHSPQLGKILIYGNQDGYLKDYETLTNFKKGNSLLLDGTQIGYSIYVNFNYPHPHVYIVHVYGGSYKESEYKGTGAPPVPPYFPNSSNSLTQYLLSKGYGVIELNLPDHLNSTKPQSEQEEDIQTLVQECIHHFAETLKTNPASLHRFFSHLKNTELILYGASFGGRTALKYAASKYGKKDFKVYVSHDGGFGFDKRYLPYLQLNPADWDQIKLNQVPLLILHNLDDNRVLVKESIEAYREARARDIPAELWITKMGNPITKQSEPDLKGHFEPTTEKDFLKYVNVIDRFIQQGPVDIKISDARAKKYQLYSQRQEQNPALDRFISEAFRIYQQAKALGSKNSAAAILSKSSKKSNSAWVEYYQPLYLATMYVEKIKIHILNPDDLIKRNILSKKMLMDALDGLLWDFFPFVEEYYNLKIPKGINKAQVKEVLVESYKDSLKYVKYGKHMLRKAWSYLLYSHPELLDHMISNDQRQKLLEDEELAKTELINAIQEYRQLQKEKKQIKKQSK